jgi:hypothetical protein
MKRFGDAGALFDHIWHQRVDIAPNQTESLHREIP